MFQEQELIWAAHTHSTHLFQLAEDRVRKGAKVFCSSAIPGTALQAAGGASQPAGGIGFWPRGYSTGATPGTCMGETGEIYQGILKDSDTLFSEK